MWYQLREKLTQPPSSELWDDICRLFESWEEDDLDLALTYAQEHMKEFKWEKYFDCDTCHGRKCFNCAIFVYYGEYWGDISEFIPELGRKEEEFLWTD